MNTTTEQAWSQPSGEIDAMAQMANELDELSNIFNIGDFDLDNIPPVDADFGEQLHQSHPGTNSNTPFNDGLIGAPPSSGVAAQDFGAHEQFSIPPAMDQQHFMSHDGHQVPVSTPFSTQSMYQPAMHQSYHHSHPHQYQYQPQPGFMSSQHVPPTPNSYELHGEAGRFMEQQADAQQRSIFEQQYHKRLNGQVQCTPMASPAGTPQFNVQQDFTVNPGAYFSPLTSPALHAQIGQHNQYYQHQQGYYTNPSTAPSSNVTSPIDPNVDVEMGMSLSEPATAPLRKSRRKAATPRSLTGSAQLRQSPIQKPNKRKSGALQSVVPSKDVDRLSLDGPRSTASQPGSAGLQAPSRPSGMSSSETDSTSPEPQSESIMGPPPRPGSALTQSPALTVQQQTANAANGGTAATPKSLLSMRSSQQINGQPVSGGETADSSQPMDDLQLPEAAAGQLSRRPSLTQINTQLPSASSTEQTPRISARKTPKLGPLSTPSSARPPSASVSPSTAFSPITASTPGALLKDKKDGKGVRGNKKRSSVSNGGSNLVSPALRPRISPSIKPLLPEGTALHSPTHALLLASKSNYQNILEGNHLPGVTYPDSLSTGLTSKRTSHKVAEQGRRNRINEALKEMQALIPSSSGVKGSDEGGSSGSPEADIGAEDDGKESKESVAKSNNSKAATVESANRYIRILKDHEAAQRDKMVALQKENEALKRRLEEQAGVAVSTEKPSDSASPNSNKAVA